MKSTDSDYKLQPFQFAFFSALFLVSGAAGLIYEIVWERLLATYFGVTMSSVTLIVAAYMAGLGLGSLAGGRMVSALKSPLKTYGLLELLIGLFGLISPTLLFWIGRFTAGSPYALVFIISFAFLLIPTFLMGMTLPLLTQAFIHRVETSGRVIGILYGINTLGAAFGSLTAAYILIDQFGFTGAISTAVILKLLVGMAALMSSRWIRASGPVRAASQSISGFAGIWNYRQILVASFLVGFIGLGFEMVWIRILHIINKNTSYGFASILFVFLTGLALGSHYWGRRADRSPDPEKLFWRVELAAGIAASLAFLLFWVLLETTRRLPGLDDFWVMQKPVAPFVDINGIFVFSRRAALGSLFDYFHPILILVLPASFFLGGGLPILDRIAINSPSVAGKRVGDIHLANITGSVFGSLLISFWMLTTFGTEWTHKFLVLLGMIFPAYYFFNKARPKSPPFPSAAIISISLILLTLLPNQGQFYEKLYEAAAGRSAITLESSDSVLALTLDDRSRPEWLWIGGETNSFYPPDGTYERRGILCAGASRPKNILVIGMGGGVSARFFQTIDGVEEIVIVELMEQLGSFLYDNVPLARPVFDDPRVRYVVDDGRRYLYANPDLTFDMIFIDPLRWYSSGHNNLYSLEAMQLYQSHLSKNGVFCAYIDQTHALPLTIAKVFPRVDQFALRTVIASNREIRYDYAYMEVMAEAYVHSMGGTLQDGSEESLQPDALFEQYLRDQDRILEDEKKSPILMDLQPGLEYYFFNAPIKRPIWLKDDLQTVLMPRILNCATCR